MNYIIITKQKWKYYDFTCANASQGTVCHGRFPTYLQPFLLVVYVEPSVGICWFFFLSNWVKVKQTTSTSTETYTL